MILNQIDHAKWQYKYTSKNPKDQAYIRRNIRAITHIDWEDVDHLINSDDKQLASQMQIFKEAITKDESCQTSKHQHLGHEIIYIWINCSTKFWSNGNTLFYKTCTCK